MKLILVGVNARFSHSNPALYSMYHYCKEQLEPALFAGANIEIKEFNINQQAAEVAAKLFRLKADVYAFSVYIWNALFVDQVLERLAKLRPDALFFAGGPEVQFSAQEEYLRQPLWNYLVSGDGESELAAFLTTVAKGVSAAEYLAEAKARQTSQLPCTGKAAGRANLDRLPFFYPARQNRFKNRFIYYESSRGCPYSCTYCVSSRESLPSFRSLELVFAELDWFITNGYTLVKFLDRSFNFPSSRAQAIWGWLIERCQDLDAGAMPCFHFELEASLLDEASVALLERAPGGLFQFEIGIQSIHRETLDNVKRKPLSEQVFTYLRQLLAAGKQHIHVDLIAGLPGETAAMFAESYNFCWGLWADMLQLGHLKLLRGTAMKSDAITRAYRFNSRPPYEVLVSDAMTGEELLEADDVAEMTDHYYNTRILPALLPQLPDWLGETPYRLMARLSELYRLRRGESLRSLAKEEYYLIMADFLEQTLQGEVLAKAKALLVQDFDTVRKSGSLSWERIVQKYS